MLYCYQKEVWAMPQITLKETITRKIVIPLETLVEVIEALSADDKEKLLSKIGASSFSLKKFNKDKLATILSDFAETGLYEQEFLNDLDAGLKKSSVYR
jgi:hypothetical protein